MRQFQRRWTPVIVSNDCQDVDAYPMLNCVYPGFVDNVQEKHRADIRFSVAVAIVLALPMLFAAGFYFLAESIAFLVT